jgi:hypothetical protein
MHGRDLDKQLLYQSVKQLIEADAKHIHLHQPKLYTLFSIAFQAMLFLSTKDPGHYILRIEDSFLAEKLARKAKDQITRNFLSKILLPRKLKYDQSIFHIDYFHIGSWAATNDLPKERIKGAIIVKNANQFPLGLDIEPTEDDIMKDLPPDFYLTTLLSIVPKSITIAYDQEYDQLAKHSFDFIKEEKKVVKGVKIYGEIDLDAIEE